MLLRVEMVLMLGIVLLLLTVFQVLLGLRYLKLGRRHWRVHRYNGLAILGIGLVHGSLALLLFGTTLFD